MPANIKRCFFSFAFIVLCVFSFTGCQISKSSPEKQTIKCCLLEEPESLDPQVVCDFSSREIVENLFEGLLRLNEEGDVVPGAAISFESNEDYTEFIFHLRKDAYWSCKEKTPILAKDFVFAIKRALKKETKAPFAYLLYGIKNAKKYSEGITKENNLCVKALDDYTIKFTLEASNKNFPKILAEPVAMPCNEDFFNLCAGQYGMKRKKILSNGPFKIKNSKDQYFSAIGLIRNENYVGESKVIPKAIEFTVIKNDENPLYSIKNKNFDISFADIDNISKEKSPGVKTIENGKSIIWGVVFNKNDGITNNLNFRKSVLSALDRNYILSCLSGNNKTKPIDNLLNNKILINFEPLPQKNIDFESMYKGKFSYFFDLFLNEAKLKKFSGADIVCPDSEIFRKITSNMIENLNKEFKCHFNMIPLNKDELLSKVSNSEYQIAIVPLKIESKYAVDVLKFFKEDGFFSKILKLDSKEYESYLEGVDSPDSKKSINSIFKAQDYLFENAIFYPLFEEPLYYSFSKNLKSIKMCKVNGIIDLSSIIKTQ